MEIQTIEQDLSVRCSCVKKDCERFGRCEECRAFHRERPQRPLPYCERTRQGGGKNEDVGSAAGRDGRNRKEVQIGALVDIVLKKDQETGALTRGHVKRILTNSPTHPRGIKVMLQEGDQVGRVQRILD